VKQHEIGHITDLLALSEDEVLANHVVLPCHCTYPGCKGWAMVNNYPRFIDSHNELYGEPKQ